MDRTQKSIKLLAVIAYVVLAISFFPGVSYATLIMVGLLIAGLVFAKQAEDDRAALPVVGAGVLYFGVHLLNVVFNCFYRVVVKFEEWSKDEEDIFESLSDKTPFSETLTDIFEVVLFLVMVAAVVFAVIAVIDLVKGKDFSKTLVGKIAAPFVCSKEIYYCANCGAAVKGGFCGKCGTKKPE